MNNIVNLPFEDFAELEEFARLSAGKEAIVDFMGDITEWCENQGVDVSTNEYKHQAAVIMTQLQIILMGAKNGSN